MHKIIYSKITKVIGRKKALLHEPWFGNEERKIVSKCVNSEMVSTAGKLINKFEDMICKYTGSKFAIAVVNGTSALHISLILAGVGKNDEVLVPALTFAATANAVSYCEATPHFVDIETNTLGIDPIKLRNYLSKNTFQKNKKCVNKKTKRIIKAIVPVYIYGHPYRVDEVISLCKDFNIDLIEDSTEALGSFYKKRHAGTFGKFGVLSFNGNKIITTGGGGAILTQDINLSKKARHLTTTAKVAHQWEYIHDKVGYNYRLPNLNAALGYAQIKKLKKMLINNRLLFKKYFKEFSTLDGVSVMCEPNYSKSNYWLQTLILKKNKKIKRNKILSYNNKKGIKLRPSWKLMHSLQPYKNCPKMNLSNAENLSKSIINLPSSSFLVK